MMRLPGVEGEPDVHHDEAPGEGGGAPLAPGEVHVAALAPGGVVGWLLLGRWWAPLAPGEVVGGKNLSGPAAPAARSAPPPLLFKPHLNPSDFLGWSRQDRIHIYQPRKIAAFGTEASQIDCHCTGVEPE